MYGVLHVEAVSGSHFPTNAVVMALTSRLVVHAGIKGSIVAYMRVYQWPVFLPPTRARCCLPLDTPKSD